MRIKNSSTFVQLSFTAIDRSRLSELAVSRLSLNILVAGVTRIITFYKSHVFRVND